MKKVVKSIITFLIALVGLIGGGLWAYHSNWDYEPIIIFGVSMLEIFGFLIYRNGIDDSNENEKSVNANTNNLTVNINSPVTNGDKISNDEKQKALTRILFIDDKHTDFKIVSILKKSGWVNTKSVKDVTDLDDSKVLEADIIFVDINGVGLSMFQDQGLGLASALKKKYKNKKIVIYSAESTGDRFHKALREVDSCLSKNAEPYQFINLIESFNKQ